MNTRRMRAAAMLAALGVTGFAAAQALAPSEASLASKLGAVITLQDYNTRIVVLGVSFLGLAAGVIGSFLLLRKRALLGDAVSHAALPGIALAFLISTALGGAGKSLPVLLAGAAAFGILGMLTVLAIVHLTRVKEDAALGIVLSVYFGLGVSLMSLVQSSDTGNAAGLQSFIYGKTAAMLYSDAVLTGGAALVVTAVCLLLFKEFSMLCFDAGYARAQGWPVALLDVLLMTIVVAVTVIGLQAVGLILMVAMLVIPPAAARFWTTHLPTMVLAAAIIGAVSGYLGAAISALAPRLPAGAVIVLVAGAAFLASLLLGPARGVVARQRMQIRVARKVTRQNLLRALYEAQDARRTAPPNGVPLDDLLKLRSWTRLGLVRAIRRAERDGLVARTVSGGCRLTERGALAAWRAARNHRLWELFLISHADVAPSHVDRDADTVEHVLDPLLIRQLEEQLADAHPDLMTPPSPHALGSAGATS